MKLTYKNKWLLFVLAFFALSGCQWFDFESDSDSPPNNSGEELSVITGTAAGGLPVVGIVNVKGADGNTTSDEIDSLGDFYLDVSDLTAPYMLYAKGTVGSESVEMYTVAMTPGHINITTITDFITRKALNPEDPDVDLSTSFDNWTSASQEVDQASLDEAQERVKEQLMPILEAYGVGDVDLVTFEFDTDHSGIDGVLDTVKIEYGDSEITITNTVTGTEITGDQEFSDDETEAITEVIENNSNINMIWTQITQLYDTSMPSAEEVNAHIAPWVADDFLSEGQNKAQHLDSWINGRGPTVGVTLSSYIKEPMDDPSADSEHNYTQGYWIVLEYVSGVYRGSMLTAMVYDEDTSKWLWYGDRKWISFGLEAAAEMNVHSNGDVSFDSKLQFGLRDEWNYAHNQGVKSAIIVGPGLPNPVDATNGSLVLKRNFPDEDFRIPDGRDGYCEYESCKLTDQIAEDIPENAVYTVHLYDVSHDIVSLGHMPLQTYTEKLGGKPFRQSEIDNASFYPSLTSPVPHSLSAINAGPGESLTVIWTNPAEFNARHVSLSLSNSDMSTYIHRNKDIEVNNATSATLDMSTDATFDHARLYIEGADLFDRRIRASWDFSEIIP